MLTISWNIDLMKYTFRLTTNYYSLLYMYILWLKFFPWQCPFLRFSHEVKWVNAYPIELWLLHSFGNTQCVIFILDSELQAELKSQRLSMQSQSAWIFKMNDNYLVTLSRNSVSFLCLCMFWNICSTRKKIKFKIYWFRNYQYLFTY